MHHYLRVFFDLLPHTLLLVYNLLSPTGHLQHYQHYITIAGFSLLQHTDENETAHLLHTVLLVGSLFTFISHLIRNSEGEIESLLLLGARGSLETQGDAALTIK